MRDAVEIGRGKEARRAHHLAEVAIVPSRRTRDVDEVSLAWQIDAFRCELPMMGHPSDATMSPETMVTLGRLGGLGVLNGEGLWARYEDPRPQLEALSRLSASPAKVATAELQRIYSEPVQPGLLAARIRALREAEVTVAVRVSPQHTLELAPAILAAGVDLLVIQGTMISAEHVGGGEPLNLKRFTSEFDVPIVVGGCATYQTALHLMRTGAAGVIVGTGLDADSTDDVLGIRTPMATAIADAAAARRDYLDETGGRYVHVIADGAFHASGDLAKAIACGADAVMVGEPLAAASEAPARGAWWHTAASHPKLPRGAFAEAPADWPRGPLDQVLLGPADDPGGALNLFGGVRRSIAKAGYREVKEFQRVELIWDGPRG